jgi:hypothetical protein
MPKYQILFNKNFNYNENLNLDTTKYNIDKSVINEKQIIDKVNQSKIISYTKEDAFNSAKTAEPNENKIIWNSNIQEWYAFNKPTNEGTLDFESDLITDEDLSLTLDNFRIKKIEGGGRKCKSRRRKSHKKKTRRHRQSHRRRR